MDAEGEFFRKALVDKNEIRYEWLVALHARYAIKAGLIFKVDNKDIGDGTSVIFTIYEKLITKEEDPKLIYRMFEQYYGLYSILLNRPPKLKDTLELCKQVTDFLDGPMKEMNMDVSESGARLAKIMDTTDLLPSIANMEKGFYSTLKETLERISPGLSEEQIRDLDKNRTKQESDLASHHFKNARKKNEKMYNSVLDVSYNRRKKARDQEIKEYVMHMVHSPNASS